MFDEKMKRGEDFVMRSDMKQEGEEEGIYRKRL